MAALLENLAALARSLVPGGGLEQIEPLAPDAGAGGADEKALGYGRPIKVTVREPGGATRTFVFRTETANEFGHDRRADRVAEAVLAYDQFGAVPGHVRALDVGVVAQDGHLVSLSGTGEPYLVTEWTEGAIYAADLRRIARDGAATPLDLARCDALAGYLARLHVDRFADETAWRRAVRDLVGHGEGIFGIADAWPDGVAGAPLARVRAIEERCVAWRWRLRDRGGRLARTHGDFHPFNVVFAPPSAAEDGTRFAVLDASRGGRGDPADDLTALSVNFVLFAVEHRAAWDGALGPLWTRFWSGWLRATGDAEVLEVAPPWLAWRALVVASPRFYPHLHAGARDALLALAEGALDAGRLDLDLPRRILGARA